MSLTVGGNGGTQQANYVCRARAKIQNRDLLRVHDTNCWSMCCRTERGEGRTAQFGSRGSLEPTQTGEKGLATLIKV